MKISSISNYNLKNYTNFSRIKITAAKTNKNDTLSPLLLHSVDAVYSVINKADEIKNAIDSEIKRRKRPQYISIPIPKTKFELDTKKLRNLPPDIRTKAIEALNSANTSEEKTEVIKKFGIAK